jgi:hypothetical protein
MVALEEQYVHMEPYLKPLLDDSWEWLDADVKIERFRLSCLECAPHLMDTWDSMDRVGKTAWATALAYCELAIRRERKHTH